MRHGALLLVVFVVGCGDAKVDKVWGDSRGVMRSASKIEFSWLDVPHPKEEPPGSKAPSAMNFDYWSWGIKSGPLTADAAAAKLVADVLLDEKSYYHGPPKACLPMPGVMLRFIDSNRIVKILLCFECRMVMVRGPGGSESGGDFDPGAPALIAAVKAAFPKDADVQKLQ